MGEDRLRQPDRRAGALAGGAGPAPPGREGDGVRRAVLVRLLELGLSPALAVHRDAALAAFWGDWLERLDAAEAEAFVAHEHSRTAYTYWSSLDLPTPDGRTIAERLLADEPSLEPAERAWLERASASHLALFEVEAAPSGGQPIVRDLWTGAVHEVLAPDLAEPLVRWDLLAARLLPGAFGGQPIIEADACVLPTAAGAAILRTLGRARRDFARRVPGGDDRAFLKRQGYRFHHFWLEHVALRDRRRGATPGVDRPGAPADRHGAPAAPLPVDAPFSADRRVAAALKARQYHEWTDQPLPGLGGRTPREAARLPRWRSRVIEHLKWLENQEARLALAGLPAHDLGALWLELDLDPRKRGKRR